MVEQPDPLETRVGIIAARRLARRADRMVELFGSIRNELNAYAMDLERLLPDFAPFPEPEVTADLVIKAVSEVSGIQARQLLGPRRDWETLKWRDIAIYIIRHNLHFSYPTIGEIFDKDHTTIITAYRRAVRKLQEDENFAHSFALVAEAIGLRV